jgi:serine protease Do
MKYSNPLLRIFPLLALGLHCLLATGANVEIQLKGGSTLEGNLLAEKRDQLVLDVGYTVLLIPRSEIAQVQKEQLEQNTQDTPAENDVEQTTHGSGLYFESNQELEDQSVVALTKQLGPAVVQVRTPSGLGSGFIIHPEGYLITNYHVIEGETEITIEVYQEEKGALKRAAFERTRTVALDKFADLALLRLETENKETTQFPFVRLGHINDIKVGQPAFAIGSPLGLERTVTEGIVSTKTREFEGRLFLQTTTQINPGNSGGPLFNRRGEVIGVTNMKLNYSEGLGFAIPVDRLKYFLNNREAYAYNHQNPSSPFRYLPAPEIMNVTRSRN